MQNSTCSIPTGGKLELSSLSRSQLYSVFFLHFVAKACECEFCKEHPADVPDMAQLLKNNITENISIRAKQLRVKKIIVLISDQL